MLAGKETSNRWIFESAYCSTHTLMQAIVRKFFHARPHFTKCFLFCAPIDVGLCRFRTLALVDFSRDALRRRVHVVFERSILDAVLGASTVASKTGYRVKDDRVFEVTSV